MPSRRHSAVVLGIIVGNSVDAIMVISLRRQLTYNSRVACNLVMSDMLSEIHAIKIMTFSNL